MKVREPVPRPLDVICAEILLTLASAFLVGVLVYLAAGFWQDRGIATGPVVTILGAFGLAIGGGWLYWLLGGPGWPLALACLPVALFGGVALLLGLQGGGFERLDLALVVLTLTASIYGIGAGFFLDSPRRWRWDQRQRPRPGTPVPRVSPTFQQAAAKVPRPAIPAVALPRLRGPMRTAPGAAGLAEAPDVAPGTISDLEAPATSRGTARSAPDAAPAEPGVPAALAPVAVDRGAAAAAEAAAAKEASSEMDEIDKGAGREEDWESLELPTSDEPRPQPSPWAWATPPDWSRSDEEDEPPRLRPQEWR